MQLMNRHCAGKLLDFSSQDDITDGCIFLRRALDSTSEPSTIASAEYAMEFFRQYYEDPTTPYMSQHEIRYSLMVPHTFFPCSLFTEHSSLMVRIPDSLSDWIKLT